MSVVEFGDDRLLGLRCSIGGTNIMLVNVYLPTQCPENHDLYLSYMGKMEAIVRESDADCVCFLGDFNAAPYSLYYHYLTRLCTEFDLCVLDVQHLDANTYTHLNSGNSGTSWIDHVIMSKNLARYSHSISVEYGVAVSDHFPLSFSFSVFNFLNIPNTIYRENFPVVNWNFSNSVKSQDFFQRLDRKLQDIQINVPVCYHNELCVHRTHRRKIDEFYKNVLNSIIETGLSVFGPGHRQRDFNVLGWNEHVSELHREARRMFLEWRREGSPRQCVSADAMRVSRARFRLALRRCRNDSDRLMADKLAEKLIAGENYDFWKAINKTCPKRTKLPNKIDDSGGGREIAEMWREKYSNILNSVQNDHLKNDVNFQLSSGSYDVHCVGVHELAEYLRGLKCGKALGRDEVPTEVFRYAPERLIVILSILFTSCLRHQHLPADITNIDIIPLLKSKQKDPSVSDNYRPLSIANVISKIFEKVLLSRMMPFFNTTDNQFGFKVGHSTDTCILTLKDTVNYYQSKGSPIFLCFLDFEKVFDKVNHFKLFKILLDRGMPIYLVGTLVHWYREQRCRVKWGSDLSSAFAVTNGIKQGGLISPYLFNICMDDLSIRLEKADVGCYIGNACVNHLSYADDMVLLAPSVRALQHLVNLCEVYAGEHDLTYQTAKCVCMVMWPRKHNLRFNVFVYLNGVKLSVVQEFKYLGHLLSESGSDDADIITKVRSIYAVGNMLVRKFGKCTDSVKTTLFRSYCYNIYCCALWSNFTLATWRKLKVAHNDIFRNLMGFPRFTSASSLFVHYNVNNLDVIVRKSMFSIIRRIKNSDNTIVDTMNNSEARIRSRIYNTIDAKLYCNNVLFVR